MIDKPTVTREQVEEARHILVGRSKPFVAPFIPEVPATSSSEKAVDNPPTFAEQTAQSVAQKETEEELDAPQEAEVSGEEEHRREEGENELQVAYTMEEISEEEVLREELQIADEAMPEVTPTAILSQDLARISRWSKEDEPEGEDDERERSQTLRTLRGTELMERLKECTLKAEEAHRHLLSAIRMAEEMPEDDSVLSSSNEKLPSSEVLDDKPLSYYL